MIGQKPTPSMTRRDESSGEPGAGAGAALPPSCIRTLPHTFAPEFIFSRHVVFCVRHQADDVAQPSKASCVSSLFLLPSPYHQDLAPQFCPRLYLQGMLYHVRCIRQMMPHSPANLLGLLSSLLISPISSGPFDFLFGNSAHPAPCLLRARLHSAGWGVIGTLHLDVPSIFAAPG